MYLTTNPAPNILIKQEIVERVPRWCIETDVEARRLDIVVDGGFTSDNLINRQREVQSDRLTSQSEEDVLIEVNGVVDNIVVVEIQVESIAVDGPVEVVYEWAEAFVGSWFPRGKISEHVR
ncbi:hypothetical protein WICPIJ_004199 [Wickerhamomyces pijperi]|uniref:Uncharacterized protein n=1 Tax=Wickerhamomyces pijperi TaxID=599730 RepID=A0A9P8TNI5_WICPI|nr:hypothetical protein WICPIJ_004199 [Wickerhamomyces pijperi]